MRSPEKLAKSAAYWAHINTVRPKARYNPGFTEMDDYKYPFLAVVLPIALFSVLGWLLLSLIDLFI
jgi:hypothetical protein